MNFPASDLDRKSRDGSLSEARTAEVSDQGSYDCVLKLVQKLNEAHIAQSVEHFLGKEEVTGSNPVVGSRVEMILELE